MGEEAGQKKPRLANGVASPMEGLEHEDEASAVEARTGSVEKARAMASGAVAEAEVAIKVSCTRLMVT